MQEVLDEHAAGVARLKAGHAQQVAALRNTLDAAMGAGAPEPMPSSPRPSGDGAAATAMAAVQREDELGDLQAELDGLQSMVPTLKMEIASITDTAQKRKEQLNAFAIEKHELVAKHSAAINAAAANHKATLAAQLEAVTTMSQKTISGLKELNAKHETRLATLEGRLGEADGEKSQVSALLAASSAKVAALEAANVAAAAKAVAAEAKVATMRDEAAAAAANESALQSEVDKLKNDMATLAEKGNDKALVDKKGAAMIKDLKKQLKSEQKRCAAIELALDECRAGGGSGAAGGGAGASPRAHRRTQSGASATSMGSLGSSSLRTSQMSLASLTPSSHSFGSQSNLSQHSSSNMITVEEHTELIHKVSRMQADRAEQNEVVRHLQNRVRAMGQDLQLKSEVISRHLSQGRVHGSGGGGGGGGGGGTSSQARGSSSSGGKKSKMKAENLQQINSTLQIMLEETLMKNIQLEKMVEALSTPPAPTSPLAGNEDAIATRM